jgi:Capsule polysaccharide biosynthesis protein
MISRLRMRTIRAVDDLVMPKRIAVQARSETRFFMLDVCREMKRRTGATLYLYCVGPQELDFYRKHNEDDLFVDIIDCDILLTSANRQNLPLSEDEIITRAKILESETGTTINMIAVGNRHLGRGYALGGYYHPRSRTSESADYLHLVFAYTETLAFWKRELSEKKIDLMVNGGKEAAMICRVLGIPFRSMGTSRYRNYQNWTWNEYFETPEFKQAFDAGEGVGDGKLERPYLGHTAHRELYLKEMGIANLLHKLGLTVARHAWWKLRRYKKGKNYYLSSELAYFIRTWQQWRDLSRRAQVRLANLKGKRFVYYPLHVEPETGFQGISPEYFYQLSLIAAVSRDLPAGVILAVKEFYSATGRRPRDFYGQICEFKNVVMLETFEIGMECAQQADAVVTICGTAGLEASVAGKPVISFGHRNIYNILPNVTVVRDEMELKDHLRRALEAPPDRALVRDQATRLLRAIAARSFDMQNYHYSKISEFAPESVNAACDALLRGLALEQAGLNLDRPEPQCEAAQ